MLYTSTLNGIRSESTGQRMRRYAFKNLIGGSTYNSMKIVLKILRAITEACKIVVDMVDAS